LLAEPVVQRRSDSNAQFTLGKDIVMVGTAHGCGDTTGNQIVALDAADVTQPPLWVFNSGEYEIGSIKTCLLDLARNRLHCVAEHPVSSFQPALFSLDTNTGALMWSAIFDTGAHARPALGAPGGPGGGHLYVGDELGRVNSFDAGDGTPHGSIALVSVADGVTPDIDADLNTGSGIYAGMVFAVSSNGRIAAFYDDGTDLIPAWESSFAGGQRVVTQAVPVESLHRLYAGTNDGNFHQLNLASGSDEASGSIGIVQNTPATTETLVIGLYQGDDGFYRMVGTINDPDIGTLTKQYRVPCAYASSACVPENIFMHGFEE
jgi:outer membrane protein assembly factor BamB